MIARKADTEAARHEPPMQRRSAALTRPRRTECRPRAGVARAEAGPQAVLLVVDGNRNVREFCKRELQREDYRVLVAGDPREALQILDAGRPDLVVTDIVEAPGMDFRTFLRRVANRDVPVILHTTYMPYPFEVFLWTVEVCVEKSADLADLKREIAKALRRRASKLAAMEDREPMCSREWEGRSWDEDGLD